jgi:hypothetical protein
MVRWSDMLRLLLVVVLVVLGACVTAGAQTSMTTDRRGNLGASASLSGGLGVGWGGDTGVFASLGAGGNVSSDQIASGFTLLSELHLVRSLGDGPMVAAGLRGGGIISRSGSHSLVGAALRFFPWTRRRHRDIEGCCKGGEKGGINLWESVEMTRLSGAGIVLAADRLAPEVEDGASRAAADWVFSVGLTWNLYTVRGHAR